MRVDSRPDGASRVILIDTSTGAEACVAAKRLLAHGGSGTSRASFRITREGASLAPPSLRRKQLLRLGDATAWAQAVVEASMCGAMGELSWRFADDPSRGPLRGADSDTDDGGGGGVGGEGGGVERGGGDDEGCDAGARRRLASRDVKWAAVEKTKEVFGHAPPPHIHIMRFHFASRPDPATGAVVRELALTAMERPYGFYNYTLSDEARRLAPDAAAARKLETGKYESQASADAFLQSCLDSPRNDTKWSATGEAAAPPAEACAQTADADADDAPPRRAAGADAAAEAAAEEETTAAARARRGERRPRRRLSFV